MVARYLTKTAHEGLWARRTALFFMQLLVLTALLHRFGLLGTPAAMNLITVSIIGLVAAIVIAITGLVRIWFGGHFGAAQAFAAIGIALAGLALPAWYGLKAATLPALTDVETSPSEPLDFKQLASQRPADANPIHDPDKAAILAQQKAYPDIRPMQLERSADEVFDMVEEAVRRLKWNIVLAEPPGDTSFGRIEATGRTMIMGFTDDMVIGVSGDDAHAQIDVRSVSRYGHHDFGENAERIRNFFAEVKTTLEKGERTGLESSHAHAPERPNKQKLKKPRRRGRGNRHSPDQSPPSARQPGPSPD